MQMRYLFFALLSWILLCSETYAQTEDDIEKYMLPFYMENLEAIANITDHSVDPCDNFYQHACGNYKYFDWNERTPPKLYSVVDKEEAFNYFRHNFTTNSARKLNLMFESCKDSLRSKDAFIEELDIIRIFPGWPYNHLEWQRQQIQVDIPLLLGNLASGGFSVFLKIFFSQSTIYLGPDDMQPCNYRRIVKQWRDILGKHYNFHQLETFSYEIFSLCKSLKAKTKQIDSSTDGSFLSDGKKLSDEFPNFEILRYFNMAVKGLNFTKDDLRDSRKMLFNPTKLRAVLEFISGLDQREIVNFILFKFFNDINLDDCYELIDEFEDIMIGEYWNWTVFDDEHPRKR